SDARSELPLGGKEGFEDLFQMFLFNSRPAVLDYRLNSISARTDKLANGNLQRASLTHRVDSVPDDIREDLKHLALADKNLRQIVELGVDRDFVGEELRVINRQNVFDEVMEMDLHGRSGVPII